MYVPIPVVYLNLPEASVHHHYYGFYYSTTNSTRAVILLIFQFQVPRPFTVVCLFCVRGEIIWNF